jgi:hypothetical protein
MRHQHEFVSVQCTAQIAFQALPFHNPGVHLCAEELAIIAAEFFSFIHSGVGAVYKGFGIVPIGWRLPEVACHRRRVRESR